MSDLLRLKPASYVCGAAATAFRARGVRACAVATVAALGLSGCGGGTPVPPSHVTGSASHVLSPQYAPGVDNWAIDVVRASLNRSAPRRSSRHRPKGGGTYKVGKPYKVNGKWYTPREERNYSESGLASWYGHDFDGKRTANGEVYDMGALTAAHKTLPMPSYAYVTNLDNNRTILVRINDRGPFKPRRIIDLSERAARELGFKHHGLARVRVRYAGRAPLNGNDSKERAFLQRQSWHRHASR